MKADCQFVVYVDEAGDEGFKFDKGSSEWFVLSGVVLPKETELATVKLVDEVRGLLKLAAGKPLHFRELSHKRRLPLIDRIASADLSVVSVAINKRMLKNSGLHVHPRLYLYCTKFLLERVSWHCRDHAGAKGCLAKIVFSHRTSTPYDKLIGYLDALSEEHSNMHWPAIDIKGITAVAHSKMRGLQIADAVCGATFSALEHDERGYTEDRYVRMLAPAVYRYKGRCRKYGLKFMPDVTVEMEAEDRFCWYREAYNN